MTKDEIKRKCRKAYVLTENNHVFDQDHPNNVSTQIYRDKQYAEKSARELQISIDTMEFYKLRRGRKIKVHEVYLVPACKID